ncbi:hypothetical protein A2967_01525 [Candidatus Daviesbacteria bacterium RIFCSPLOWO2_01_FULL_41_32]|uniref:Uncharacterized protein n=1 Tax=Candidatus Daviesbacteria bacterium RIFCSPHIGHO2_01_FULL_41_23 TaxID=1797764 RepID=A0A1F5ISR8_9BACT|nr:MAG: hypothetical protein A2871_01040 [Candidatus Daviesbacteria bacterium RIFCSPHIGHO2_01_FULL_41_23]OGE62480.1 MAG: hypothetical protein A2967_01525 [Candidatus Daviesbacteria bacterium RIFCSPLOWO2_01_FULL_41_32]
MTAEGQPNSQPVEGSEITPKPPGEIWQEIRKNPLTGAEDISDFFTGVLQLDRYSWTDPKDPSRRIKLPQTDEAAPYLKKVVGVNEAVREELRKKWQEAAGTDDEAAKANCLRLATLLGVDEAALQSQVIPPGGDQAGAAATAEPTIPAVTTTPAVAAATQPAPAAPEVKPKIWQRIPNPFRKTPASEASTAAPARVETGQGPTEEEEPEEENVTWLDIGNLLEMNLTLLRQTNDGLLSSESKTNIAKWSDIPDEEVNPQIIDCLENNPTFFFRDSLVSTGITEQGIDPDQLEAHLATNPLDIIYCSAGKISRASDDIQEIIETAKATIDSGEYRNKLKRLLKTNPLIALQTGEGMLMKNNLPESITEIITHTIENLKLKQVQQYTNQFPLDILLIVPANLRLLKPENKDALIKEANKIKFRIRGVEHIKSTEIYDPLPDEEKTRAGKFWDDMGLSAEARKITNSADAGVISSAAKAGSITLSLGPGPLDDLRKGEICSVREQARKMGFIIGPLEFDPNTGDATAKVFPARAEDSYADITPEDDQLIRFLRKRNIPEEEIRTLLENHRKNAAVAAETPQPGATGEPAIAPASESSEAASPPIGANREPEPTTTRVASDKSPLTVRNIDQMAPDDLKPQVAEWRKSGLSEKSIARHLNALLAQRQRAAVTASANAIKPPPEKATVDDSAVPEIVSESNFGKTVKATLPSGKPGETALYQGTIIGIETGFDKPRYVIRLNEGTIRIAQPEDIEFLDQPAEERTLTPERRALEEGVVQQGQALAGETGAPLTEDGLQKFRQSQEGKQG